MEGDNKFILDSTREDTSFIREYDFSEDGLVMVCVKSYKSLIEKICGTFYFLLDNETPHRSGSEAIFQTRHGLNSFKSDMHCV